MELVIFLPLLVNSVLYYLNNHILIIVCVCVCVVLKDADAQLGRISSWEQLTKGHSFAMAQFRLQNVEDFYEIGDVLGRCVCKKKTPVFF